MPVVRFIVPGPVRGKGRPRFVKATGRTYTDEKTMSYEDTIRATAPVMALCEGPVAISLWVLKRVPASWSCVRREAADYIVGKPDIDNVAKLVLDALNGIAYHDDTQVASLTVIKRYGDVDSLVVEVRTL
jgi:Holliday junction resolvase RusA-like endonuclease